MQMIYEENVEGEDFLELIMSPQEMLKIQLTGFSQDFILGLLTGRNLNVFLRVSDITAEANMPLIGGKSAKSKKGFAANVKAEIGAGKPQKQAVAIAYSQARKSKKKAK